MNLHSQEFWIGALIGYALVTFSFRVVYSYYWMVRSYLQADGKAWYTVAGMDEVFCRKESPFDKDNHHHHQAEWDPRSLGTVIGLCFMSLFSTPFVMIIWPILAFWKMLIIPAFKLVCWAGKLPFLVFDWPISSLAQYHVHSERRKNPVQGPYSTPGKEGELDILGNLMKFCKRDTFDLKEET